MSTSVSDPLRVLVRDHLDDIPVFPLPSGYSVRWYQPGDEQHWIDIHVPGYAPGQITLALFQREFPDQAALPERQCYVLDPDDVPVGTATAWVNGSGFDSRYGCVHWVAVAPQAQRLGIAKAMMTIILQRFRALGYTRAYLRTSNPIAVELYRQFGFVDVTPTGGS